MYSCTEAPPEAFPPISHKHEKPKERRRGQGCEAPAGLNLDRAAAFGSVLWLDGREGRLGVTIQIGVSLCENRGVALASQGFTYGGVGGYAMLHGRMQVGHDNCKSRSP